MIHNCDTQRHSFYWKFLSAYRHTIQKGENILVCSRNLLLGPRHHHLYHYSFYFFLPNLGFGSDIFIYKRGTEMILSFFDRNVNTSKSNLEIIHFSKPIQTNSFSTGRRDKERDRCRERIAFSLQYVNILKSNWAQNEIAK